MPLRFGEVEIDERARELRVQGELRSLQPQAWAVLSYLLRHRDRVVPKAELLESLWDGAHVTEGSLQRAVSLARSGLGARGHELLRTVPKQGYRFVAPEPNGGGAPGPDPTAMRPRYAENDGIHLAYYTLGEPRADGIDMVFVAGWALPAKSLFELPSTRAQCEALARLGRTVLFDKRGIGESDRPKQLPDLKQRMSDLVAILDELGSERALLIGVSEGGPLSLQFAATHPERTRGLVLGGCFPCMGRAPGFPHGWSRAAIEQLRGYIRRDWGRGSSIVASLGDAQVDEVLSAWAGRAELQGASPGAALELLEMNLKCDARGALAQVRAPVHLVHGEADPVVDFACAEYLAEHLSDAVIERRPGREHAFLLSGPDFWAERAAWVLARG